MIYAINSDSLKTTLAIGSAIGAVLKGGETIELKSDLGGGKTALTKGIAAGMESKETVQSPTFTVSRIYKGHHSLELHHFDFYRLTDPGVMAAELAESLNDERAVVVVEWSDIVADILPDERVTITITATSEESRLLEVSLPDALQDLHRALYPFISKG